MIGVIKKVKLKVSKTQNNEDKRVEEKKRTSREDMEYAWLTVSLKQYSCNILGPINQPKLDNATPFNYERLTTSCFIQTPLQERLHRSQRSE